MTASTGAREWQRSTWQPDRSQWPPAQLAAPAAPPCTVSISADYCGAEEPSELTLWCSCGAWLVLMTGSDEVPLTEVDEAAAEHLTDHPDMRAVDQHQREQGARL